jgi:hypothetical protein
MSKDLKTDDTNKMEILHFAKKVYFKSLQKFHFSWLRCSFKRFLYDHFYLHYRLVRWHRYATNKCHHNIDTTPYSQSEKVNTLGTQTSLFITKYVLRIYVIILEYFNLTKCCKSCIDNFRKNEGRNAHYRV